LGFAGDVGNGADVEAIVEDFVGDVAREHAVDADLDAGMGFAEFCQRGEEGVDRAFVDAEGEFAALQAFEFGEAFFYFVAEIEEAFGVFLQKAARVGEADGAGTADEEWLAEGVFELTDAEADSGLGAVEAFGSAGEAAWSSPRSTDRSLRTA
jgi:hypothetical protein